MSSTNKYHSTLINRIIVLFLFTCLFYSCTEDSSIEPGIGLVDHYYPLEEGNVRTYSIDSIIYDYDGELRQIVVDTQRLYLKEHVMESVEINGESWFRIGQYMTHSLDGEFQLVNYAYERKTAGRLLRKEGHLTFIPLSSPLELYEEWDGTAYFNKEKTTRFVRGELITPYQDWNYIYLQKWDNYTVGNKQYHDVLQINQRDTISIEAQTGMEVIPPEKQLFYYLANEFYAPQIGLIEKEEFHLSSICASSNANDFQSFCDSTTIFVNAERGYIHHKKLISIE